MSPRTKVVVVLLALLAGCVLVGVVSREARAERVDLGSPVGDYGWAAIAFIVLAIVFYKAIVGLWRATRVVRRGVEWVRSRPSKQAEALQAALDEDTGTYDAVEDFDANVDAAIAERLHRKAKYDSYAAEMYSAFRELGDDQLIKNVIDLWGRTYKP